MYLKNANQHKKFNSALLILHIFFKVCRMYLKYILKYLLNRSFCKVTQVR